MNDLEAVRLLHSMVRIPSVSGEEDRLARFLAGEMQHLGFTTHVDEIGNVIGEVGQGDRTIALIGHIDTVPGALPVEIKDGRLYGRGTVDAKGPMAAFIAAASRYSRGPLGRSGELRVRVVGCVGEEAPSSRGARHLAQTMEAPDLMVIGEPSGWEGITLGYKGYLRATITMTGAGAHSAHDVQTLPAQACSLWQGIVNQAQAWDASELVGGGVRERAYDRLIPALLDLACDRDGLMERVQLQISLRLPPDLSPSSAKEWLHDLCGAAQVEILGGIPAWCGSRSTPMHRALAQGIRHHGGRPNYKIKTGTADLNILAPKWGCPALAYGPGDAALDHTPEEHIILEEFERGVRVLEATLEACSLMNLERYTKEKETNELGAEQDAGRA